MTFTALIEAYNVTHEYDIAINVATQNSGTK